MHCNTFKFTNKQYLDSLDKILTNRGSWTGRHRVIDLKNVRTGDPCSLLGSSLNLLPLP